MKKSISTLLFPILTLLLMATSSWSAVYTVTNLNDTGAGSLRQAITDANANPGIDDIQFTVAGTLSLVTTLPISEGVNIDGTTAPGYVAGTPSFIIETDAAIINSNNVSDITLKGLHFLDSAAQNILAVTIQNGDNILIEANVFENNRRGLFVATGGNVQVLNNAFNNCGYSNNYSASFSSITDLGGTRLKFEGNTFDTTGAGLSFSSMDNLTIDDTNVPTTPEVYLPSSSGIDMINGTVILVTACNNITIDGMDFSNNRGTVSGAAFSTNNCSNLVLQNNTMDSRHQGFINTNLTTSQILNNTFTNVNAENISISTGEDATVTGNSFTNSGTVNNRYTVALSSITQTGGTGNRVLFQNNTFSGGGDAISLSSMDDLEIDETVVGGTTEIHLPDTDGRQGMTGVSLNLAGCANVVIEDFNFSCTTGSVQGTALQTNACHNLLVQDNTIDSRHIGVNVTNSAGLDILNNVFTNVNAENIKVNIGEDATITGNSFTNSGTINNRFTVNLNNITQTGGTGNRLLFQTNTFSGGSNAIALGAMDDLEIDETFVGGTTEVHLPDTDGRQGMTGVNLNLAGCANIVIEDFNFSCTTGSVQGAALQTNACHNLLVQNNTIDSRSVGINVNNSTGLDILNNVFTNVNVENIKVNIGEDATITGNSFTNSGTINNRYTVNLNNITQLGGTGHRLLFHDNDFNSGNNAIALGTMDQLEIDEVYVAGTTEVHLPDADGRLAYTGTNIVISNCDNIVIEDFNLSNTSGSVTGTALNANSCDNLIFQNNTIDSRSIGLIQNNAITSTISNNTFTNVNAENISIFAGEDVTISGNSFTNSGTISNRYTIKLTSIGQLSGTGNRLSCLNNSFNGGGYGIQLAHLDDIVMSDGAVANTEITVLDADNLSSITNPVIVDCDNFNIQNVNLKAATANTGRGIYIINSLNAYAKNIVADGYGTGIFTQAASVTIEESLIQNNIEGVRHFATTALTATLQNINFSCNADAIINQHAAATVIASNNFWGQSDGSSSDTGSGDSYDDTGTITGTTTFLSAPHGGTTITTPMIALTGNGNGITNGQTTTSTSDDTDFGGALVGGMLTKTFTINNGGADDMTITGISSSASQFTISGAPTTVAGNSTATFDVVYSPDSEMTFTSTISVDSDDCYEGTFDFDVTGGIATPAASLRFDGVNDHIALGNLNNLLNGSTAMTIQFHINLLSDNNDYKSILESNDLVSDIFSLETGNGGLSKKLYFYLGTGQVRTTNDVFTLNSWRQITIVYDGSLSVNDRVQIFVDGVEEALTYIAPIPTSAPNDFPNFYFSAQEGTSQFTNMELDELRIWNTAVDCGDVVDAVNCELTGTETGLIAYYQFNEGVAEGNNTGLTNLPNLATTPDGTLVNFAMTGTASNWISPGAVTVGSTCTPNDYPEITVNESSQGTDFGDVAENSSSTIQYTITNDGAADLDMTSITSDNGLFTIANYTDPTTVISTMTTTFDVVFSPTAIGSQSATISIASNDCDEDPYTFTVMGNGVTSCDVAISNVSTTNEMCVGDSDGTLTVTATCTTCTSIEYSLDGTNYQASNVFTGLSANMYTVTAQDSGDSSCSTTDNGTVGLDTDSSAPSISCNDITVDIDNSGSYTLTAADLVALTNGTTDDCSDPANLTITASPNVFDCDDVAGTPNNYALSFDETNNERVSSSSNVGITGNVARTLEFWIRMDETDVFNEHIINWGGVGTGEAFGFYQTNNSELEFYTHNSPGGWDYSTGHIFDAQKWYHIAASYDGVQTVSVFVDGLPAPVPTYMMPGAINTIDAPLQLAVRPDLAAVTNSTIDLDEVRIWNYARTQAEIQAEMNLGLTGNETGLVLYYDMEDNGPGTTVVLIKDQMQTMVH